MPSSMIHYCVANRILQMAKLDRALFIAGNLAPDAHTKAKGGRLKSHFQKKSTDLSDVSKFKGKYMCCKCDDFILGYYCHLITDIISYNNFNSLYLKETSEEEKIERLKKCYNDYCVLNSKLISFFKLNKENIIIPKQLSVDEIDREQLVNLINNFHQYFKHDNNDTTLTILDMGYVLDEINEVAQKCLVLLKDYI